VLASQLQSLAHDQEPCFRCVQARSISKSDNLNEADRPRGRELRVQLIAPSPRSRPGNGQFLTRKAKRRRQEATAGDPRLQAPGLSLPHDALDQQRKPVKTLRPEMGIAMEPPTPTPLSSKLPS
jgi:hypothetical protein